MANQAPSPGFGRPGFSDIFNSPEGNFVVGPNGERIPVDQNGNPIRQQSAAPVQPTPPIQGKQPFRYPEMIIEGDVNAYDYGSSPRVRNTQGYQDERAKQTEDYVPVGGRPKGRDPLLALEGLTSADALNLSSD